ncbi:MAG TPA: hypothetical protein DCM01_07545 [Dielma fastidiosa]|jgi:hypothetical protein|nr:hypothetical protein [Dielma fastidiosa]
MKKIKVEELAGKELEVLEDGTLRLIENKNHGRYIPPVGEWYYFISDFGDIHNSVNDETTDDDWNINHNLVFRTEEECKEYKKFLELLDEYKCELNWEDKNECKYYLYYDKLKDYLDMDANSSCQTQGAFYFKSMADAKEFIKKAGKYKIKQYMFDVWE